MYSGIIPHLEAGRCLELASRVLMSKGVVI
jgi:hypothetical protein